VNDLGLEQADHRFGKGVIIGVADAAHRKCLGYQTPIEAFAANLGVAIEM
jgi:hypothetical protein